MTDNTADALLRELVECHGHPFDLSHPRERWDAAMKAARAYLSRAPRDTPPREPDGEQYVSTEEAERHQLTRNGVIRFANSMFTVAFRAGLLACREYMARFVEAQGRGIAQSIRANWWPSLGADPGPPRLNDFAEWYEGEYPNGKCVAPDASIEALPYALQFLQQLGYDAAPAAVEPQPNNGPVAATQGGREPETRTLGSAHPIAAPAEAPPAADDLVARLRLVQTIVVDGRYLPLCEEAAARIESLQAELSLVKTTRRVVHETLEQTESALAARDARIRELQNALADAYERAAQRCERAIVTGTYPEAQAHNDACMNLAEAVRDLASPDSAPAGGKE